MPVNAQEGLSGNLKGNLIDDANDAELLPVSWSQNDLKEIDSEGRTIITQHKFKVYLMN